MVAIAPLTSLHCFVSPYPTHASGSLLFLQLVSDRLAARHVVLVVCPQNVDVCCCPAMWCIYYVPLLPRCVLLAGWLCWHVPL